MSEKTKRRFYKPEAWDILIAATAAVVLIMNLQMVGKCYNPFVFNDEAGYWTHAYAMAGYDWRSMSSTLAWYSYGYSFMLFPLVKLFHDDPVTLYRSALVLNAVLVTAVYLMFVYILRFLFPKLKKAEAGIVAAAAALYTSYQHNTGIAFSETALLFVTVLTVFTLIRIIKKTTYLNMGCFGSLCAYLFMIHNRTIGIAASAVLVIALGVVLRKISLRHAAMFFGVFVLGMTADHFIHGFLESYLWASGKAGGGNDSAGVIGKLKSAVTSTWGMKRCLSLLASQAFSAFSATFCIALFALWKMFRDIVTGLSSSFKAIKKKKKHQLHRAFEDRNYVLLFIFCGFISTWIISSVFMLDFQRIDHVIYNRYYDITVGLLIMTGLCYMLSEEKADLMFMISMPAIMFIGAHRAAVLMNDVTMQVFSRVCSPGVSWYYERYGQNFFAYALTALSVFVVLVLMIQLIKRKRLGLIAASVLTAALFTVFTVPARVDIFNNQRVYTGDRELTQRARENENAEFYVMPEAGAFISFIQYMIPDHRIQFAYDLGKLGDNAYIFADINEIIKMRGYEIADKSDRHILYRNRVAGNRDEVEIPLSYMNTFDSSFYIADEDVIKSSPDSNYLCYGPYLELDEGKYVFSLDMAAEGTQPDKIGYAEVKSVGADMVYAHVELTADMADKSGNVDIDMEAEVKEPVSDLEIVVFLYDPDSVSVQLNSIKVNTEEQ